MQIRIEYNIVTKNWTRTPVKGWCAHIVTNWLTISTKCGIKLKSIALKYREISISNKQTKIVIIFISKLENSPKLYSLRFIYNRISLRTIRCLEIFIFLIYLFLTTSIVLINETIWRFQVLYSRWQYHQYLPFRDLHH